MTPRRLLTPVLAALVLLAGACSSSSSGTDRPAADPSPSVASPRVSEAPRASGPGRYVAMGDSFSAGPLIPTTNLVGGCARSDHNYPSLVAADLGVRRFVDVTCSGATTADVTGVQHPFPQSTVPAQVDAVTRDTDLVTIGIGGNDLDLFATLIGTCTRLRAQDPTGSPCTRALRRTGPDLTAATATIARNVTRVLRAIERKAPRARVLLVGYLRLAPDHGTCADLPLAAGDYPQGRRIASTLNRALTAAATRTNATYVDAYALSKGHDICSAQPWVNGRQTRRGVALAYHPLASGMRAVAAQVERQVRATTP
ncbi:MAG: SGNH/GDSL hydrolase family protein [Nocardioidaceae bacterium]|nr:SGNH/GDSL hydrolase family protein [Nocardioidaceae bacterium]NUS52561.1 SGNH/GDSL hydrolase family protein [Nocardioidaceae bacterium]